MSLAMDYHGQRTSERLGQGLIVTGFVLGTAYGWFTQSLEYALYGWLIGLFTAMLICVPAWPCFRRHPIKWLPVEEEPESGSEAESSEEMEDDKKGLKHKQK